MDAMNIKYLPNIITCLRFLLIVPLIFAVANQHFTLAFYLFLLAGVSDGLDGFLARRFNWSSRFGSIADPIADKLLLTIMLIVLTSLRWIPVWLLVLVVARDV